MTNRRSFVRRSLFRFAPTWIIGALGITALPQSSGQSGKRPLELRVTFPHLERHSAVDVLGVILSRGDEDARKRIDEILGRDEVKALTIIMTTKGSDNTVQIEIL